MISKRELNPRDVPDKNFIYKSEENDLINANFICKSEENDFKKMQISYVNHKRKK